uniref:Semaphorin-2A n=1 Tax=Anopheles farauti TaxID=69004 RepID=A0A182QQD4_9DIPT
MLLVCHMGTGGSIMLGNEQNNNDYNDGDGGNVAIFHAKPRVCANATGKDEGIKPARSARKLLTKKLAHSGLQLVLLLVYPAEPNFVGSFDIGEHVYFFFRETAVEYINCGKAVYSRVARVCKKDTGGKNILNQNWATYLKARINCSISGEFPFYFNEIQDVYQLPTDKTKFYATFTTSTNGLVGSAVCSFDINEIHSAFAGKFKEQASSNSAWLPVLNSKIPEPRPGTCVDDTSTLPDLVLNFIRSHPLMDKAVNHEHNNPVYYKRDLVFTKLVVDKIKIEILSQEYTVFYIGTNAGRIYKIVQYLRNGESKSKLLDIFEIAQNEAIQVMELSQKRKSLYVATDYRIKQIDLAMCNRRYDNCFRCVKDPYCGWDKDTSTCKPYEPGLLQDVGNETYDICDTSVLKKKIIVTYGQSVHLGCFVKIPEILKDQTVTWYHHSKEKGRYEIKYNPTKYIETTERGLVVISVNEADGGRYDCHLGGSLLCSYNITVDAHRCTPPNKTNDYQKIYSDWCHEFEKYKSAMKTWEKKQAAVVERKSSVSVSTVAIARAKPTRPPVQAFAAAAAAAAAAGLSEAHHTAVIPFDIGTFSRAQSKIDTDPHGVVTPQNLETGPGFPAVKSNHRAITCGVRGGQIFPTRKFDPIRQLQMEPSRGCSNGSETLFG